MKCAQSNVIDVKTPQWQAFKGVENNGFKNDAYVLNSRNPIWSFGNALTHGISYYQASAGIGNKDTIAFDFGTNTSAAAKFYVTSDGNLSASGSISSNGVVIGTLAEFTAALG